MADPPGGSSTRGSLMSKKVAGIPVPVIAVGAGVAILLIYRYVKAKQAASSSGTTSTPSGSSGSDVGLGGGSSGYPVGPSGVVATGFPSTAIGTPDPGMQPGSTATAPATAVNQTQPPTPPQSGTVSTVGAPLPGFPSSQPVLGTNVGARPGQVLVGLPGAAGASYTVAPAGTTPAAAPGYSPSLGKIIPASQAIPGEQYQSVPGQPGMLQVIT